VSYKEHDVSISKTGEGDRSCTEVLVDLHVKCMLILSYMSPTERDSPI